MRPCCSSSLRTSSRNVLRPEPTPSSNDWHACPPLSLLVQALVATLASNTYEHNWSIRSLVHDLHLPERRALKAAIEVRRAIRGLVQAHDDRGSCRGRPRRQFEALLRCQRSAARWGSRKRHAWRHRAQKKCPSPTPDSLWELLGPPGAA